MEARSFPKALYCSHHVRILYKIDSLFLTLLVSDVAHTHKKKKRKREAKFT